MAKKQAEPIRALGVVLLAGKNQLKRLPRGALKGRTDGLRLIALEALDSVEKAMEDCAEAYLEERFGILYLSTVVDVRLHRRTGIETFQARIVKCEFSGLSGDPDKEAAHDRLKLTAVRHAPGDEQDDASLEFVFIGSAGDEMAPVATSDYP
jgi:hypothetical protein